MKPIYFTVLTSILGAVALSLTAAEVPAIPPEAEVYLLAGQSNMQGVGELNELPAEAKKAPANAFFWNGTDFEPLIPGKTKTSTPVGRFGPEIGFAAGLTAVPRSGHPIYLIKFAISGQPLHYGWKTATHWAGAPPAPKRPTFYPGKTPSDPNTGLHYLAMRASFTKALAALERQKVPYTVRGIVWMQGEADAKHATAAKEYGQMLRLLKTRLEQDLKTPSLPLVYGQVLPYSPPAARFVARDEIRARMQAADHRSGKPESIPGAWMVPTDDFPIRTDHVHYTTEGQWRLGNAFAKAMQDAQVAKIRSPANPAKPNIIFILADDAAYRDFSCMGQTNFTTPNIDRLAREGRVFSNAYAGGPWCAPSRSCLLTGMNGAHLNALERDAKGIPTKLRPTIAEMLKTAGYATCVVGKWHTLDDGRDIATDEDTHKFVPPVLMPWHRGFDVCRIRKPEGPDFNFPKYFATGDNQRIDIPENQGTDGGEKVYYETGGVVTKDSYNQDGNYVDRTGKVSTEMVFAEDVYRKEVRSFMRTNASTSSAQGKGRPFFIFYATPLTHRPLITKSLREFKDKPGWMLHQKALAAMTLELDDSVGAIMDELKKLGLEKKTLVIFSSDNGYTGGILYPGRGMSGLHVDDPLFLNKGPWVGGKHSNLNGGVTVPMIAWGPGLVTPGKTGRAVGFSDVMATAAELTGTPLPGPTDGVSIVPLLQGRDQDQPAHPSILWPSIPGTELGDCQGRGQQLPREYINAVLLDERFYAMIRSIKGQESIRVFDTVNDPGCQHELSAARPDLCARAKAEFKKLKDEMMLQGDHGSLSAIFSEHGEIQKLTSAYVVENADGTLETWNCTATRDLLGTITVTPAEAVVSRIHFNLTKPASVQASFGSKKYAEKLPAGLTWFGPGGVPEEIRPDIS